MTGQVGRKRINLIFNWYLRYIRNDFKKNKTAKLVTLSKKGGRGQEKGKI